MKKLTHFILACAFALSSSLTAFAGIAETEEVFKITDSTTVGEVMRYSDSDKFYSYSEDMQTYLNSIKFKQGSNETYTANGLQRRTLVAGLSSSAKSPKKGQLNYSGTISCNTICPSIYLSAIAYDSNGTVVSEMANTKNSTTKCSVSNIETGLSSGKYHVTYYGIIEPTPDYEPNPGIVESTKNVTVK